MKIANTLEDILKDRGGNKKTSNAPDTYEDYIRKNGLIGMRGYADAVGTLYAASKKKLSSYGINNREISNKGLQNSGYASYIDEMAKSGFASGLDKINDTYAQKKQDAELGYLSYLEKYNDKTSRLKKSVLSHLVKNGVTDVNTAIAYGVSAGLSSEDAAAIGKSAYELTRQKVFNSILEQTVRLGLDSEGARQLAVKMGVSDEDAKSFAEEIQELLDYYGNISEEYLEFLEQRNN